MSHVLQRPQNEMDIFTQSLGVSNDADLRALLIGNTSGSALDLRSLEQTVVRVTQ